MEQERTKKLFFEVTGEFEKETKDLEAKSGNFQKIYNDSMNKVEKFIRSKCGNYLDWLESNTEQSPQGPVLKDRSKQKEFESTLSQFETCLKSNDVGFQELFVDLEGQMQKIEASYSENFQKCTSLKTDDEIKNCFRKINTNNFSDLNNFYTNFTTRFEDFNKKI
jgi:hypothetical protein